MLDVMRSKASSWLIKIVFGLIILSFILFFGYRSLNRRGGTNVAASVNGQDVPMGLYRMAYDDVMDFYKKMYKGNIPDGMEDQIRQTALLKVINQALIEQAGKKLGLTVVDQELYNVISNNPNFQEDGVFQKDYYTNQFLPTFMARFNMNYEDFLRDQILIMKTTDFLTSHVSVSAAEAKNQYMKDNTLWSFERIKVADKAPKGVTYDMAPMEIAKKVIDLAKKGARGGVKRLIKKYKLAKEDLEAIGISDRYRLIPSEQESDFYGKLFQLSKKEPVYNSPIDSGGALYIFILKGVERPTQEEWEKDKTDFISKTSERAKQEYLLAWQNYMKRHAKIEQFVLQGK